MTTVTQVRKEPASDGIHQHIKGVCTTTNDYYTRKQVVDSINAGEVWETSGGGSRARIKVIPYCPYGTCLTSPYITTAPDHTTSNNLDNLPPC
jgi:hypothetical protein